MGAGRPGRGAVGLMRAIGDLASGPWPVGGSFIAGHHFTAPASTFCNLPSHKCFGHALIPLRCALTCLHHACAVLCCAALRYYFTLLSWLPSYFVKDLGMDLSQVGAQGRDGMRGVGEGTVARSGSTAWAWDPIWGWGAVAGAEADNAGA